MSSTERRRSERHLLGAIAEVHIGPKTVSAIVNDVSKHGLGLTISEHVNAEQGEMVWILVSAVARYALTGRIQRVGEHGSIGVELLEILKGEALEVVESLPLMMTRDFDGSVESAET